MKLRSCYTESVLRSKFFSTLKKFVKLGDNTLKFCLIYYRVVKADPTFIM